MATTVKQSVRLHINYITACTSIGLSGGQKDVWLSKQVQILHGLFSHILILNVIKKIMNWSYWRCFIYKEIFSMRHRWFARARVRACDFFIDCHLNKQTKFPVCKRSKYFVCTHLDVVYLIVFWPFKVLQCWWLSFK